MKATTFRRSAVALGVAGAFALGVTMADHVTLLPASAATPPAVVATPLPSSANTAASAAALPDFSGLAEQYGPAVVNISVVQGTKTAARMPPSKIPDEDELPPFFHNFPFQFNMPHPGPMRGVGSGFIVTADGIILTNAHVVDDADEVTVKLTDKREFTAKVLGSDKTTDIAVLRIEAKNLPTVKIGNRLIKVGRWVVAIGSPYGREHGHPGHSAPSRALPEDSYVPFIQTDAAEPRQLGRAPVRPQDEVIGIIRKSSAAARLQNLAFAIPRRRDAGGSDRANGHASHGRLGIAIKSIRRSRRISG
jgi:serine protease Do